MNEIIFPITRGTQGASVADLHQALRALFQARALFGGDPAALREVSAALARELAADTYGPITARAVTQFQKERRLDPTGTVDERTAKALNEALHDLGGADPAQPAAGSKNALGGVIRYEHGLPADDLHLRLYRHEFGGKVTRIAETTTQTGGRYAFALDGRDQIASVEVRAVTNDRKEVSLSKPLLHLTAESRGRVNLIAPAELRPLAAEYHRLRDDLGHHVGEMGKLAEAKEDDERQDLSVLRRATGWDARLIGLAAVTERLAADPEIGLPQEGLYGLLRVGLPSDKRLLARVVPDVVEMALEKANSSGVVSLDAGERAAFKKKFSAFASRTRLLLPTPGSRSTYKDLLQSSGLPDAAQQKFAAAYLKHGGDSAGLWSAAKDAGLTRQEVRTLQLQGKYAFLVGNSAEMTARLLKKGLTDPAELADRDLFEADTWKAEVLEEAAIPVGRRGGLSAPDRERLAAIVPAAYPGERVEARLDAYAEDLARKVRLSYPTQVLGRLMKKDPKFALPTGHDVTLKLLENATAQGFRLGETPVSRFMREHANLNDGLTQAELEEAQAQLGVLSRVYQITPCNEAMPVLLSLRMTSGYDVMAYSKDEFIAIFADKYHHIYNIPVPTGLPILVYQKAQQVSSVTYNLFAIAKKMSGDLPVAAISAPLQARESARNELIKHFPTMESLFGSMDYCDCEHCRSVLSPAAYLVDLLQFVDAEPAVWSNFQAHWSATHGGAHYPHPKPYDVLVERRPDLPHLDLTCENTHTALPYIDIVNEILEYYVANGGLAKEAARNTDDSSTAELLAEPQNVIREAYDSLRSATFPLNLPFDLWVETVRKFCDYFETPLHRVLEALLPEQDILIQIRAPTNVGQATVDVANADAARLRTGLSVTHRSINGALSGEWRRITVVGAADSGGPGWSTITFGGTWGVAPTPQDMLVIRPLAERSALFMESLGLAPAEVELFTDPDPFTNDKWHQLYGLPAVRAVIAAPTNVGQATLTVLDAEALLLRTGLPYSYIQVAANAAINESKILETIGSPGSGGVGRTTLTFEGVWGVAPAAGDLLTCDARSLLRSAKALARRLGVTYEELAQLVQCTFVNPEVAGLSLLHKLGVAVADAKLYQDERAFYEANKDLLGTDRAALPAPDQLRYDALAAVRPNGPLTGWQVVNELAALEQRLTELAAGFAPPRNVADLRNALLAIPVAQILVLADPDASCNFDRTIFQYAGGANADPIAFLRINLLVRLWRKLGWSLEETDRALTRFTPSAVPFDANAANLTKQPLETALVYLAHLKALGATLKVGKRSRLKLLALWGNIATTGKASLYAELFLRPSVLQASTAFDDPLGQYLSAPGVLLSAHVLALQGALGLTAVEIRRILEDGGIDFATTDLTLANVSRLYRYALLAKGLGLTVTELIILKQLSGLDPFKSLHPEVLEALDQDYALVETIELVKVAAEVEDCGLSLDDLDYLFRHRFDSTGKYRPTPDATLAFLRGLSEGVRGIRAAHVVPTDPSALSEDFLRQELGLAFPPAVVDRFLGMVSTTGELTATVSGVLPADNLATLMDEALALANAGDALARRVVAQRYQEVPFRNQTLTLRGVVLDPAPLKAKFQALLSAGANATFDQVLREQARLAREFFDAHLKKQRLRVDGEAGFLEEADFAGAAGVGSLFAPLEPMVPILATDSPADVTLKEQQNRDADRRNHAELQRRRTRIGSAFLPFLQARLIRRFVIDALTGYTGADPTLVESLIGDDRWLALPLSPLSTFVSTSERGVDATFYPSADATGVATPTALMLSADTNGVDPSGRTLRPAGSDSARLEGYLEVPTTGAYRFYVELDRQNARAELRFPHRADPVLFSATAAADRARLGDGPEEYLELKAGVFYRWSLDLTRLNGAGARLLVQGEQVPRGPLTQLKLYPARTLDAAAQVTLLLRKALQLVQAVGLSDAELRYILSHAGDFGGVRLSDLPLSPVGDTAVDRQSTAQRFSWFRRLAAYARLKRELSPGTDDLLGIFEANGTNLPGRLDAQVYPRIAQLTRRDVGRVKATAEALVGAADTPHFESERPLLRLWEALQVIERFGLQPSTLAGWRALTAINTTGARRFELAREAKEAIKARFDPEDWRRVAKPIFDQLRPRQRDALVSHVMHQRGFERIEQLYEYFLIDPGMEPVVQTSRVRLAIASVQLFIQRSLLNLEPKVQPAVIDAEQWEWMKRYRVWEANRKIFLFPENWLEPEFRDDKTHLYAELEGALLQGDVSSDLVEDAFLGYLRKLDVLARLDICAMHIEDNQDPANRVLHVFGRSYAEPHEYFYRRYAHQMWTPWEPVSAEIEGDHLAPVIWRDRLYLFWVTFLDQNNSAPASSNATGSKKVIDVGLEEAMNYVNTAAANKRVGVQLHWSEHMAGEWTTRASGSYPEVIARTVPASFDPRSVFVHVSKEYGADGVELGVKIHLAGAIDASFHLAGRNSAPEAAGYQSKPANPFSANVEDAVRYGGSGPLRVTYRERIVTGPRATPPPVNRAVLRKGLDPSQRFSLLPSNNQLTALGLSVDAYRNAADPAAVEAALRNSLGEIATLVRPVFYQDGKHTFFLEPDVTERTIEEWEEWVTRTPETESGWVVPDWWDELVVLPEIPMLWPIPEIDLNEPRPSPVDGGSLIYPTPMTDWLINTGSVLRFGDVLIGPNGRPGLEILEEIDAASDKINVSPGHDLPGGHRVAVVDDAALADAGLEFKAGGLNIVGAAGFNATLNDNYVDMDSDSGEAGMPLPGGWMGRAGVER